VTIGLRIFNTGNIDALNGTLMWPEGGTNDRVATDGRNIGRTACQIATDAEPASP